LGVFFGALLLFSPLPRSATAADRETLDEEHSYDSELSEVAQQVEIWAAAWSMRQVSDYLHCYSANFRADPVARLAWERRRRERVGGDRQELRVEIDQLTLRRLSNTRIEARFLQEYESPTYRDRVQKTLVFGREEEEWKIVEERQSGIVRR